MPAEYAIHIYDTSGDKTTEFRPATLSYKNQLNAVGVCQFSMPETRFTPADIAAGYEVEVRRRNTSVGLSWYTDWSGFVVSTETTEEAYRRYQYTAHTHLDRLNWRVIAYPPNTANRSVFTGEQVETIQNTLVKYNATSSGTTGDGRYRTATLTGVSVEADGADGTAVDWECAGKVLLPELQRLAEIDDSDFDLMRTAAGAYQWRYYTLRGTDRSSTLVFSIANRNMINARLTQDYRNARSVAIVTGQGDETAMAYAVRTSSDYNATTYNRETYVAARSLTTTAELEDAGDQRLQELAYTTDLQFDVRQTDTSYYGLHYVVGDKVTSVFAGVSLTQKIIGASVDLQQNGLERIAIDLRTLK